ncbi:Rrf2 family transcriptional regulator [Loigolactobacillus backii]|uniref:Rrf2 family transcriptional regulator n=1 Tax=Loigolactobacillus backii TaxID=375175 RepID=UPI0022FD74D8|nr:Rrf2 family transcriptional regulator [Loigolactobacillus backii]MDA5387849.1 Rrf2 family transcriptional regulator [Loigolactobacillus backii]MDA5390367.1 Rrf2 family transcriptional regulator [Loigolactobacillus backii]
MQLTRGFEQAACIITLLATQDPDFPISSEVIHHRLNGSQTYLRKIMRKLVVAGLVKSVSGNNGGFTIARPAKNISLYDVVQATEGDIHTYPDSGLIDIVFKDFQPVAKQGTSVVNSVFSRADSLWEDSLKKQSVYQLISETLGESEIPLINWNETDEKRELLIQRLLHNLH